MNVAYSSKACRFPMTVYSRLFALDSVETVKRLCSQLAIGTAGEHILFLKGTPLKDGKVVLRPSGSLFDICSERTDSGLILDPRCD